MEQNMPGDQWLTHRESHMENQWNSSGKGTRICKQGAPLGLIRWDSWAVHSWSGYQHHENICFYGFAHDWGANIWVGQERPICGKTLETKYINRREKKKKTETKNKICHSDEDICGFRPEGKAHTLVWPSSRDLEYSKAAQEWPPQSPELSLKTAVEPGHRKTTCERVYMTLVPSECPHWCWGSVLGSQAHISSTSFDSFAL